MRLLFFVLSYLLMATQSIAQSRQQQKVDSVFQLVKQYFNQKNADAIYNMAGADFEKELSISTFSDIANKQIFPFGKIKESTLISFVNNSTAIYKLKTDTVTLQLSISLDQKEKLQIFLFQRYQEPVGNKTAMVPTSNKMVSVMDTEVDSVARLYIQKSNTVGLCIGILKDGKMTTYGYGETVKGNGKIPNADNFFEIGSITKTFTSTLLALYVNEGKLNLADPITKYLPDSVAVNPLLTGITLLNLSNHTSGLARIPDNMDNHAADPLNPYKNYTKELMFAYLKSCKITGKPGAQYGYSNLGVALLGTILEQISGKRFEQMVTELICKPLSMFTTSQYLNPLLSPRFVAVYNEEGMPTPAWDFDVMAPCGALRSTVNDLLIYSGYNLHPGTNALGKAITLTHQVTFNKDIKIGLAWHIIVVNGVNYYFHNGGTFGSSSFLAFNPEKNLAIVVLSNAAESTDAVGVGILKKVQ